MATNDKDNEFMDTQVDNTRGYDESHDRNSGLPPLNMEYNGNQLNSRDRNGENIIIFKKSA